MTITVADAQARLGELIRQLGPGEDVVITADDKPVARLISLRPAETRDRVPGTLRGSVLYVADDFDAPLEDFREYME